MTESEAERRANLAMIEEKALGLLSRNERHRLRMACSAYGARQINVDRFIHTLVGLLGTPNKVTWCRRFDHDTKIKLCLAAEVV